MSVVDDSLDHPLKLEEHATMSLAGGLMQNGYQCGMLWGAALAAGAQAYRLLGSGPQAETEAITASQKLVESFRAQQRDQLCRTNRDGLESGAESGCNTGVEVFPKRRSHRLL